MIPAAIWGGFALWFRISDRMALKYAGVACWVAYALATLGAMWSGRPGPGSIAFAVAFAVLAVWWSRLRPVQQADWADELARETHGVIEGSRVTLYNVRNFEWRTTSDYTQRWETRSYDLDRLRCVDMVMSYWRGPAIAHMLMSFGFYGGARVAFSVEIRRKRTQEFSEIGGFFKEFELSVIAVDELDAIWLRTNVRLERVHLYALRMPREAMRALFLGYVGEANSLAETPRFYHTITSNCTTLVFRIMQRIVGRLPLSYRLLFSGYMPEYVYGIGGLDRRHTLDELRERGYVSERARQCGRNAGFSTCIRNGIPSRSNEPE